MQFHRENKQTDEELLKKGTIRRFLHQWAWQTPVPTQFSHWLSQCASNQEGKVWMWRFVWLSAGSQLWAPTVPFEWWCGQSNSIPPRLVSFARVSEAPGLDCLYSKVSFGLNFCSYLSTLPPTVISPPLPASSVFSQHLYPKFEDLHFIPKVVTLSRAMIIIWHAERPDRNG